MMLTGRIHQSLSGFYQVYVLKTGAFYQTRARGNFRKKGIQPVVGDYVEFEAHEDGTGYILKVLPRKNELIRPPVANIDQAICVMSVCEPELSTYLLDQYLVYLESESIQPLIVFTKLDLWNKPLDQLEELQAIYTDCGYPCFFSNEQMWQMWQTDTLGLFSNKVSVVMGQTGVGKSTLLNHVLDLSLQTGAISKSLGRGKHTTRSVALYPFLKGWIADTPGFSQISLLEIDVDALKHCFPEFQRFAGACKFRACLHDQEPGCAVKHAAETGAIAAFRYEHYLQFLKQLQDKKPRY